MIAMVPRFYEIRKRVPDDNEQQLEEEEDREDEDELEVHIIMYII